MSQLICICMQDVPSARWLGWLDFNFECSIALSAQFCLGWWEFGRSSWAAGQDGGTPKSKLIQPRSTSRWYTLYVGKNIISPEVRFCKWRIFGLMKLFDIGNKLISSWAKLLFNTGWNLRSDSRNLALIVLHEKTAFNHVMNFRVAPPPSFPSSCQSWRLGCCMGWRLWSPCWGSCFRQKCLQRRCSHRVHRRVRLSRQRKISTPQRYVSQVIA